MEPGIVRLYITKHNSYSIYYTNTTLVGFNQLTLYDLDFIRRMTIDNRVITYRSAINYWLRPDSKDNNSITLFNFDKIHNINLALCRGD